MRFRKRSIKRKPGTLLASVDQLGGLASGPFSSMDLAYIAVAVTAL